MDVWRNGLRAVFHWERVVALESRRLRIMWFALGAIALVVLFSGYIPSDGTDVGRVRVVLRLVEAVVTFVSALMVIMLGAYFFPYEEIQNRRILLTGVVPADRWTILAGIVLGIFRSAVILLAAGVGMLALKLYVTEDLSVLRHVAGRRSYPASFAVCGNERCEEGSISLGPGEKTEICFKRHRPDVGAALRVTPYGIGHSLKMVIALKGREEERGEGALTVMRQAAERLVDAGSGETVFLVLANKSGSRISIPMSEARIVEEEIPLWGNMLRAMALRWVMLMYLALSVVGMTAFLGMVPTLITSGALVAGGYLAPFVNALFALPRFTDGLTEAEPSWMMIRVVGKAFGDLVHTSPGESLPLGELIEFGRMGSALALLVNGGIVFCIGCYVLSRRELAR